MHVWRKEFLNDKFHSDLFIFQGFLCFKSYLELLSFIYNNKNYVSLPYILFIAVQNSRITLDRAQYMRCNMLKIQDDVAFVEKLNLFG